ncbi:winged helix-turn-helix domain-containing protein [Gordonia polyisoprenivorans]|uniref:winged helix-turn-helix domain-containing protein n=1 Tax=Gordonia polyisoprenivorans TaxID=84595 RepID=UPI000B99EDBB|nr:winged helix-turn-helix domain-containing protein [Gordonia polyisoprenivorans]MBE7192424.1 winged helix-turn-helix domain-containing protein [Gordonia polyisoprenivorans]OZC32451.1 hypothetical protein CJJ17_13835 [Gordonia polyisoprenivorans]UZF55851.1 winged helix-turn-helix domain-containing protein [Gordonia polyisoprenivorans]
MTDTISVLQLLRLKGRTTVAALSESLGIPEESCETRIRPLIDEGRAIETNGRLRATPEGREHLTQLLAEERAVLDTSEVETLYREFDYHNDELKSLMTRWQLKSEDTPNDHSDADYDAAIIDDLTALHQRFTPLLARIVTVIPRLGHYPGRFDRAISRIGDGDHSWFAKPLADSYHTVWFELHEDLIGAAGRTRADEAAAGRAL